MDVKMAGMDGLEGLKRIRQLDSNATVVMISGHATIQTAVEATQLGAYDILEKPLDTDRILVLLRNALQKYSLQEENARLRETIDPRADEPDREGGRDAGARAHHGRERDRQGTRGPCHPSPVAACQ
jgi:two-component system nitrogen regulation response regulator NtrX